ncbi:hypothetical protein LCGC14_1442850 [marine sediment metagenome]|uniref:Uncharacterized protein n=1 Tax=marine sediment metagenome TaxID=412755 RepID=A0A0F9M0K7_9ZZZZ
MIEINGKEFKINLDIRWGTQKLMRKIQGDMENPKNDKYMEYIMKDLLIPSPSTREMMEFRRSDIENIFTIFGEEVENKDKDFKKKRSI